ncbi:cytochrome c biogenesis protein CcdA, partial [Thioclava sp. BHET1]
LGIAALGQAAGLGPDAVARGGALVMAAFGLVLLLPVANRGFSYATAGLAARADRGIGQAALSGAAGQFIGGLLLGAGWSPCIGPTLGGAIALAAQGQDLGEAAAVMLAFAFGTSTIVLAVGYGARGLIQRHRGRLIHLATLAKPLLGVVFLLVGLMLFFGINHILEAYIISWMPPWLQDVSVSI